MAKWLGENGKEKEDPVARSKRDPKMRAARAGREESAYTQYREGLARLEGCIKGMDNTTSHEIDRLRKDMWMLALFAWLTGAFYTLGYAGSLAVTTGDRILYVFVSLFAWPMVLGGAMGG